MEKGNLVAWCKNEGDEIAFGDVIIEVDTDKATMEVESTCEGTLAKILIPAGTHDVPVKTPIAIIRQKNDTDVDVRNAVEEMQGSFCSGNRDNDKKDGVNNSEVAYLNESESIEHFVKASPLAKRIANEYGVDILKIVGSGPDGRIVKDDVLKTVHSKKNDTKSSAKTKYVDYQLSSIGMVIAEKLTMSKKEIPHFYMTVSVDVTKLLEMREDINNSGLVNTKITVNDLVVKAVALAMKDERDVNVTWHEGLIRKFNAVDISIAVAIDDGLITPILEEADRKSLIEISCEIKELVELAKVGKLKANQIIGGGITVSNLGMYGIDSFLSIINSPQGSILSIGPAKKVPVYDEKGDLVAARLMKIGYAIDHRVIDGKIAAKFLEALTRYLENPVLLLL
jgi:pyruvate dehydrogenase E2 component (dihydrolipoamide acetyltransferase)